MQRNKELRIKLKQLFENSSQCPTDNIIHQKAEEWNYPKDVVEDEIYGFLYDFFSGGNYIKKGKGLSFDPEQLKMGIAVEYEHTNCKMISERIALDHLTEIPDYYTRLDKMESEAGVEHHDDYPREDMLQEFATRRLAENNKSIDREIDEDPGAGEPVYNKGHKLKKWPRKSGGNEDTMKSKIYDLSNMKKPDKELVSTLSRYIDFILVGHSKTKQYNKLKANFIYNVMSFYKNNNIKVKTISLDQMKNGIKSLFSNVDVRTTLAKRLLMESKRVNRLTQSAIDGATQSCIMDFMFDALFLGMLIRHDENKGVKLYNNDPNKEIVNKVHRDNYVTFRKLLIEHCGHCGVKDIEEAGTIFGDDDDRDKEGPVLWSDDPLNEQYSKADKLAQQDAAEAIQYAGKLRARKQRLTHPEEIQAKQTVDNEYRKALELAKQGQRGAKPVADAEARIRKEYALAQQQNRKAKPDPKDLKIWRTLRKAQAEDRSTGYISENAIDTIEQKLSDLSREIMNQGGRATPAQKAKMSKLNTMRERHISNLKHAKVNKEERLSEEEKQEKANQREQRTRREREDKFKKDHADRAKRLDQEAYEQGEIDPDEFYEIHGEWPEGFTPRGGSWWSIREADQPEARNPESAAYDARMNKMKAPKEEKKPDKEPYKRKTLQSRVKNAINDYVKTKQKEYRSQGKEYHPKDDKDSIMKVAQEVLDRYQEPPAIAGVRGSVMEEGFDPEKADLNKDGKLSEYETKRGKAIADNMDKNIMEGQAHEQDQYREKGPAYDEFVRNRQGLRDTYHKGKEQATTGLTATDPTTTAGAMAAATLTKAQNKQYGDQMSAAADKVRNTRHIVEAKDKELISRENPDMSNLRGHEKEKAQKKHIEEQDRCTTCGGPEEEIKAYIKMFTTDRGVKKEMSGMSQDKRPVWLVCMAKAYYQHRDIDGLTDLEARRKSYSDAWKEIKKGYFRGTTKKVIVENTIINKLKDTIGWRKWKKVDGKLVADRDIKAGEEVDMYGMKQGKNQEQLGFGGNPLKIGTNANCKIYTTPEMKADMPQRDGGPIIFYYAKATKDINEGEELVFRSKPF